MLNEGVNNLQLFLDLEHSLVVLELDVYALNRLCLFLDTEIILIKDDFLWCTVLGFLTAMVELSNREFCIQVI